MTALELIHAGYIMNYSQPIVKDAKWVADGLRNEVIEWFGGKNPDKGFGDWAVHVINLPTTLYPSYKWPVLINAPTGRGKNWFTINVLSAYARNQGLRVLILTNRDALTLQQRYTAAGEMGFPPYCEAVYENCCIWGNLDIINYQSAIRYIKDTNIVTKNHIGVVVFDEAHFFTSDSSFNSDTSYILQQIIKRFYHCKRIYMSATPEDVKPVIALEEWRGYINHFVYNDQYMHFRPDIDAKDDPIQIYMKGAASIFGDPFRTCRPELVDQIRDDLSFAKNVADILGYQFLPKELYRFFNECSPCISEYKFEPSFKHVKIHFYYDEDAIIDRIKFEQNGTEMNHDKWLIFVSTKDRGNELMKRIGSDSFFIYSDMKGFDDEDEDKKAKKKYKSVVANRRFEEKVMISTTVFYNGVSLEDPSLKNIVVDTLDRVELVQMLGRKRCDIDENVHFYIKIPTVADINERIKVLNKRYNTTMRYLARPQDFFNDEWKKSNFDNALRNIFSLKMYGNTSQFVMSDYAPRHFAMESGHYGAMKELLENEQNPCALEKEICSWFNQEYSEKMQLGETLSQKKERIREEALEFIKKYAQQSPFEIKSCEELWSDLKALIMPNVSLFSDKPLSLKHHLQPEEEAESAGKKPEYNRLPEDIKKMLGALDLPYAVKKCKRAKQNDLRTWRYEIVSTNDNASNQE